MINRPALIDSLYFLPNIPNHDCVLSLHYGKSTNELKKKETISCFLVISIELFCNNNDKNNDCNNEKKIMINCLNIIMQLIHKWILLNVANVAKKFCLKMVNPFSERV